MRDEEYLWKDFGMIRIRIDTPGLTILSSFLSVRLDIALKSTAMSPSLHATGDESNNFL